MLFFTLFKGYFCDTGVRVYVHLPSLPIYTLYCITYLNIGTLLIFPKLHAKVIFVASFGLEFTRICITEYLHNYFFF
jgi:hypothetical protein